MKLRVLYFASMRDQAGVDSEQVETSASDAHALFAELRERHGFTLDAARLRVAMNGAFATWEQVLRDDDEVVFMPPVSGG